MLSVALCTFNGARYIREQIESILNQTMKVDEIVVCDDGSADDTLAIIESLREDTTVDIRINQNETNQGVCTNFQKAINLCHGDIIFLADQDDIWHTNKVETIVNYFEHNKSIQVVFTDGILIDKDGNRIYGKTLWECVGMTESAQTYIATNLGIELFENANRATGATMAVKSSFSYIHCFQNYCNNNILHDYALSLLALGEKQLGCISECLIDYRIHSQQQVGVGEYLMTPMNDNIYTIGYNYVFFNQLHYPEPVSSRISFIIHRDRSRHKALGLFRILGSVGRYRKLYGSLGGTIFKKDASLWMQNMWHRFF